MRICMVPDANIAAMLLQLDRLGMAFVGDYQLCSNDTARNSLRCVERILRDLGKGRIDCQTRVRCNRSALELLGEYASRISLISENFAVCEAVEEIVRHTGSTALDSWEVGP